MAVVFGEAQADGWIKVTMISYQMDEHENGFSVPHEEIPPYPEHIPGVGHVQMYHPKKDLWRYDRIKVPFTQEEVLLEIATSINGLTAVLAQLAKVQTGTDASSGSKTDATLADTANVSDTERNAALQHPVGEPFSTKPVTRSAAKKSGSKKAASKKTASKQKRGKVTKKAKR